MSKGLLIALALGVIVLAGVAYMTTHGTFSGTNTTDGTEVTGTADNFNEVTEAQMMGDGTIADLLRLGKSIMCTVSYTPEGFDGTVSGIIYVAQDKVRADMKMTSSIGEMKTSVIQADGKGYTWGKTPMGEMAMMFDVDANEQFDGSDESVQQAFDVDANVKYECEPWSADMSKFIPPSNIDFVDMEEQFETTIQPGQASTRAQQCGSCEQIPDEAAKAQCLQILNCVE